jgi:hypothetical protein
MKADNGMSKRQYQFLSFLCSKYGDAVDLLALDASPGRARSWLHERGLKAHVLDGGYALAARLNAILWYALGVVLCSKLHQIDSFRFLFQTPLPRAWIDRYEIIVCFYAWPFHLLGLARAGAKLVVDTGDVMADRHKRIGSRRWVSLSVADEAAVLRSQGRRLAISEDDACEFDRLYGVRACVLPFVPPEHAELERLAEEELPPRIGFLAAPSYVNEVMLRLMANAPFLDCLRAAGVELLIAGGICETADPPVLNFLERGGARILGRVDSLTGYYREIGATVNPVGPSTGAKIKSIETLVAGRNLITTRWGAGAALAGAFPGQVVYVDWPVLPAKLGELCVETVRTRNPGRKTASEAYVRSAAAAFEEAFIP